MAEAPPCSSLEDFFALAQVPNKLETFKETTGATEVEDLFELNEEMLTEAGFKKIEVKRFLRYLNLERSRIERRESSNSEHTVTSAPDPVNDAQSASMVRKDSVPLNLEPSSSSPTSSPAVSSSSSSSSSSPSAGAASSDGNRVKKDQWRRGEKIGQGAFGMVYKGLNTATGEIIAIKELNFDSSHLKSRQLKEMIKEVELMRRLSHPNIVKYLGGQEVLGARREEGGFSIACLCIFTEFVAGGSVESLLEQYGALDDDVVRRYAKETLDGLAYLHSEGILRTCIIIMIIVVNLYFSLFFQ